MAVISSHLAIPSPLFGMIYRPRVEVEFKLMDGEEWLNVPMIVDTGADYTILPKWLARDLNVNLEADCEQHSTEGIGGAERVFLLRRITVRLGHWVEEIPVGFLNRDDIPPLLGREDFSEKFRLIFENFTTIFIVPRRRKNYVH